MPTVGRRTTTTLVRKSGGAPEVRSLVAGKRTPSQLATGKGMMVTSPSTGFPMEEVVKVADMIRPDDSFARSLLANKDESQIKELISIVTPLYDDWEDEILTYEAFTVAGAHDTKSLFVKFLRVEGWLQDDLTQSLVALIELAEGILDCDHLYVCVEKDVKGVASLAHSLMYVGFNIRQNQNTFDSKYLVMEYETE